MREGWKCPVCGMVWNPEIVYCLDCEGVLSFQDKIFSEEEKKRKKGEKVKILKFERRDKNAF